MTTPPTSSYRELGFQIAHFKFAIRMPKLHRPRILKRRRTAEVAEPVTSIDWASDIHDRYQQELRRSTTASTATSYDWIRDFHARYNPVVELKPTHASPLDSTIFSDNPESTSTPINLRIQPLNQIVREGARSASLNFFNMSGVKIYENLKDLEESWLDSHGSCEPESSYSSDQSYEIVSVVDHKVIARAHFKPLPSGRTLKSYSGTLTRNNIV